MRYRVSLDFTMWMINIGLMLLAAALLVTLWKIYVSLKELNHVERVEHSARARVNFHAMKRVLVATSNEGKIRDLIGAAAAHGVEIATLAEFCRAANSDRGRSRPLRPTRARRRSTTANTARASW